MTASYRPDDFFADERVRPDAEPFFVAEDFLEPDALVDDDDSREPEDVRAGDDLRAPLDAAEDFVLPPVDFFRDAPDVFFVSPD